jgi:hypothetical protein
MSQKRTERALETKKLRMLTETGRLEALLESLVRSLGFLPENAERLTDRARLPDPLQRIAENAEGKAWCAWQDGGRLWFYSAEMSLSQSREKGKAVLRVTSYSPEGEIVDSGWWMRSKSWSQIY